MIESRCLGEKAKHFDWGIKSTFYKQLGYIPQILPDPCSWFDMLAQIVRVGHTSRTTTHENNYKRTELWGRHEVLFNVLAGRCECLQNAWQLSGLSWQRVATATRKQLTSDHGAFCGYKQKPLSSLGPWFFFLSNLWWYVFHHLWFIFL